MIPEKKLTGMAEETLKLPSEAQNEIHRLMEMGFAGQFMAMLYLTAAPSDRERVRKELRKKYRIELA
jgi:hypothetical protein